MGFKIDFDLLSLEIEIEYSIITDFFNTCHSNLPNMELRSKKEIEKSLPSIEENVEEHKILGDLYFEQHYKKYKDYFPNKINYQFIIMNYSFLETNIKKLFDDYTKKEQLPFSIDGFGGDLSTKIMRFIRCYKPEAYNDSDIQTVKELSIIRNNIVHNMGYIGSEEKKIIRIIEANKSITIKDNHITILKEFCDEYNIKTVKVFRNLFRSFGYRSNI